MFGSVKDQGVPSARFQGLSAASLGWGGILVVSSLCAMGVFGLATRRLVPGWQPLPPATPFIAIIAVIHALILIGAAGSVVAGWHRLAALRVLGALLVLWMLLHLPVLVGAPTSAVAWLGIAEVGAVTIAVWLLVAAAAGRLTSRRLRLARMGYGTCALIFGLSHVVYAGFTASMVPTWLGFGLFWTYLTAGAHASAGAAMLSGHLVRLAATSLAVMMGVFALLVHVPRVASSSGDATEIAFLVCALALCGSAWTLAEKMVPSIRPPSRAGEDWTGLD